MRQLRTLAIVLALAGLATLFTACDSLFGEYNNPLDHYVAETVWFRPASALQGYGYKINDQGYEPTQGSPLHIAANPAAASPDADDALYLAYSVESGGTFGPVCFETKTQSFSGPNAYVRDLIVDANGNAYLLGIDLADDQQKIYSLDFSSGSVTLISAVPRSMPWRLLPPEGGSAISPDGREISVSLPTEFVLYRYTMSTPGDTSGTWDVVAGTPAEQGSTTNGNGGLAAEALLGGPFDLTTGLNGDMFFLDTQIEFIQEAAGNYSRSDAVLRRIDPDGTISGISPIQEFEFVTLPDVPIYFTGWVDDSALALDSDGNLYANIFSGIYRIEGDTKVATQMAGDSSTWELTDGALLDWTAETGLLAKYARDIDLRYVNDIAVAANGDVFASQGGFGNLQGLRIVRLYQTE